MYQARRPGIIAIASLGSVQRFLDAGIAGGLQVSDRLRHRCRQVASTEVERIASLMESEPMGLQFGLLPNLEPSSAFKILRARDRATLVVNPFRSDDPPSGQIGVSMITVADEAVAGHQRVAEALWRSSVKGAAAAHQVRRLLATSKAA